MTFFGPFAFDKCSKLEEVSLRANNLDNILPGLFYNNKELKKLYLDDNQLTSIEAAFFATNHKLTFLSLKSNLFSTLPSYLFAFTPDLTHLVLHNNTLKEFSVDYEMPALEDLSLSLNLLSDLDVEDLVKKCPKLRNVALAGNRLTCARKLEMEEVLKGKPVNFDVLLEENWQSCRTVIYKGTKMTYGELFVKLLRKQFLNEPM